MRFLGLAFVILMSFALFAVNTSALPTFNGKRIGFYPITNEVSFYQNVDDPGRDRGQTLQVVSINTFKLLTRFNFEFTADFNWGFSYLPRDHYMELSLVKEFVPRLSLNYQRIISSFEEKSINQFGLRISF
ncbi:exported hypothetical protein [Candidatus Zixiibacteriota bacterium]|nr:exported hypothetical protein [candidate division Zixibacteria bacterium]